MLSFIKRKFWGIIKHECKPVLDSGVWKIYRCKKCGKAVTMPGQDKMDREAVINRMILGRRCSGQT